MGTVTRLQDVKASGLMVSVPAMPQVLVFLGTCAESDMLAASVKQRHIADNLTRL